MLQARPAAAPQRRRQPRGRVDDRTDRRAGAGRARLPAGRLRVGVALAAAAAQRRPTSCCARRSRSSSCTTARPTTSPRRDATVGELLNTVHIKLGKPDYVAPAARTPVHAPASRIAITRVSHTRRQTGRRAMPFSTVKQSDSSMYTGQSTVVTAGRQRHRTRSPTTSSTSNGKVAERTLISSQQLTAAEAAGRVKVGTKSRPAPPHRCPAAVAPPRRRTPAG